MDIAYKSHNPHFNNINTFYSSNTLYSCLCFPCDLSLSSSPILFFFIPGGEDLQEQEEEAEEETEAAGGAAGEEDAGDRGPGERG